MNNFSHIDFQVQDCKQANQYMYWRVDNPRTWSDSLGVCETVDRGSLVSIHDFEEQVIVLTMTQLKIEETYLWIGLHCPDTCKSPYDSIWSDGTSLDYDKLHFLNNYSNKCVIATTCHHVSPDSPDDNMVQYCWDNHSCDSQHISLCKVKIQ